MPTLRPVPYPLGGHASVPTPPLPNPLTPPMVTIDPRILEVDLHGLVGEIRESVDGAFEQHLSRIESTFGSMLERMEAKLAQAELELAAVRAEHARVKAETEKKADALRELKKALENI